MIRRHASPCRNDTLYTTLILSLKTSKPGLEVLVQVIGVKMVEVSQTE